MNILITGVTGTLGSALVKKILDESDHNIIGISRDEQKQRLLPKHPRLKVRLADVRDMDSLYRKVPNDVELIFHLAALKCVDTIEDNPFESVKTNVLGTQNIVDLGVTFGARVCFTSTDKAAHPINAYGQCKALAEKLVLQNHNNVVVRYGNVLGSRGSILSPLIKSLPTEGKAYLTHEEMTRFWMPIDTVVGFVHQVAFCDIVWGLVTPKDIKAAYVVDLIQAVAKILRVYDYRTEIIGIRPGEKLHEVLLTEHETEDKKAITTSDNPLRMTSQELHTMLKPIILGMI